MLASRLHVDGIGFNRFLIHIAPLPSATSSKPVVFLDHGMPLASRLDFYMGLHRLERAGNNSEERVVVADEAACLA